MDPQQKFQIYNKHHLQKPCKICNTDNSQQFQFVFCDNCDDGYHCKCLTPPLPENQVEGSDGWLCPQCRQLQPNQSSRLPEKQSFCYKCGQQLKIQTIHEVQVEYINEIGQKSKKFIKEIQKLAQCRVCRHQFHPVCFSHRLNSLNCWKCEKSIRQRSPKSNVQFMNYINEDVKKYKKFGYFQVEPLGPDKIQGKYQRLQKINLNIFPLATNWELICRMQMSLYYALQTNQVHYCRTQLYLSKQSMSLNHSNKNIVQPSKLHESDQKIYELYRQYTINNYMPPLQVRQDRVKGFYVVALQYIPKRSLLCEYAGEVLTRKQSNKNYKQNDSIMSLLVNNFADNSLDIIPVKFSNVSRFILGIPSDRKDLQNVQTLNFCYEGRSHIIFFSTSNIEKGDILYIDYNEGLFEEYPTENFII